MECYNDVYTKSLSACHIKLHVLLAKAGDLVVTLHSTTRHLCTRKATNLHSIGIVYSCTTLLHTPLAAYGQLERTHTRHKHLYLYGFGVWYGIPYVTGETCAHGIMYRLISRSREAVYLLLSRLDLYWVMGWPGTKRELTAFRGFRPHVSAVSCRILSQPEQLPAILSERGGEWKDTFNIYVLLQNYHDSVADI